jgi:hypothetical protein
VAQVEFEKRAQYETGLTFKGKGLKPVAFKLWVNRVQQSATQCSAPPLPTTQNRFASAGAVPVPPLVKVVYWGAAAVAWSERV